VNTCHPEGRLPSRPVSSLGGWKPPFRFTRTLLAMLLSLLLGHARLVTAQSVLLHPVADTTLIEAAPNNNLGGKDHVNAGTTQNFTKTHGLFRFDPAAAIPAGSIIHSVSVSFEVVGQPVDGYAPSQFGLHRVLVPWGEGDKNPSGNPGLGLPATAGEATWNDRFALEGMPWSAPGGAPGTDFLATSSSTAFIYDIGSSPYLFASTPDLVADVQGWLDHPSANFGWMLLTETDTVDFTARRFASREDAGRAPVLEVNFTVVPEPATAVLLTVGGMILAAGRRRQAWKAPGIRRP
jgi:hypothetical protein